MHAGCAGAVRPYVDIAEEANPHNRGYNTSGFGTFCSLLRWTCDRTPTIAQLHSLDVEVTVTLWHTWVACVTAAIPFVDGLPVFCQQLASGIVRYYREYCFVAWQACGTSNLVLLTKTRPVEVVRMRTMH